MDLIDIISIVIGVVSLIIGIASLIFSILSYVTVKSVREAVNTATSRAIVRAGYPDAILRIDAARNQILKAKDVPECQSAFLGLMDFIPDIIFSAFATDEIKQNFQELVALTQEISKNTEYCDLNILQIKITTLLAQIKKQLQTEE